MRLELFLSDSHSLKDKRMCLRSLKQRLANNFNVAVSEIEQQDKWQKAVLGLSTVGTDTKALNRLLSHVVNYVEGFSHVEVLDYQMEFF